MDLQEDIAAKLEILKANAQTEQDLLPQGDKVPADAQAFKDELTRITKYVEDLQAKTKVECDKFSNDVKALDDKVKAFDNNCVSYLKVLDAANAASQKMTTHTEAENQFSLEKMESTLGELKNIFKQKEAL